MVTKEERARGLFEQGNKSKEVSEILSDRGIKTTLNTIRHYYTRWNEGFRSHREYQEDWAKNKGFRSYSEYQEDWAKNKGFGSYSEYRKYLKDPDFKEIYNSDGIDEVREDNPYFLMLRLSERKYELEMEAKEVEEIKRTEKYKKLEEILPEEGGERIEYIGKLRKGLKILRQLGKI